MSDYHVWAEIVGLEKGVVSRIGDPLPIWLRLRNYSVAEVDVLVASDHPVAREAHRLGVGGSLKITISTGGANE